MKVKFSILNLISAVDDQEYPGGIDQIELRRKIKEANEAWSKIEPLDKIDKKVGFYEPIVTMVIEVERSEEPSEEASGQLSHAQRKADKDRLERLLTPIFKNEHRDKMRTYIDNCFITTPAS